VNETDENSKRPRGQPRRVIEEEKVTEKGVIRVIRKEAFGRPNQPKEVIGADSDLRTKSRREKKVGEKNIGNKERKKSVTKEINTKSHHL